MLSPSAISWSSATDFRFSSAMSTGGIRATTVRGAIAMRRATSWDGNDARRGEADRRGSSDRVSAERNVLDAGGTSRSAKLPTAAERVKCFEGCNRKRYGSLVRIVGIGSTQNAM